MYEKKLFMWSYSNRFVAFISTSNHADTKLTEHLHTRKKEYNNNNIHDINDTVWLKPKKYVKRASLNKSKFDVWLSAMGWECWTR